MINELRRGAALGLAALCAGVAGDAWPQDGGASLTEENFREYIACFNQRDYACCGKFTAIAPVPRPASQEAGSRAACNRSRLQAFVDEYLAALVVRDPARLRITDGARFTENGQPRMLALRLKIAAGRISEIETISGMPFTQPSSPMVSVPSPAFAPPVPVAQRLSCSEMIAAADGNFDGILAADGSHFAADCQRVENRMAMSGNPALDYPIASPPGHTKPAFAAMGCQAQVAAHLFDTLDSVDPRRYLVIDEERQLVFGVFMLNWYRDNRCNDVVGYGRVCRPDDQKPTALRTAEILRVAGGKVHQVEVVFSFSSYQAPSGWELP